MTSAAYVSYLLAITHYRLGRAAEAGKHLGEANRQAEQVLTDADDPPPWNRRLTLELLRREAKMLAGKPTNECNLLLRGRGESTRESCQGSAREARPRAREGPHVVPSLRRLIGAPVTAANERNGR